MKEQDLVKKVALVTGGGTGIGAAISVALADAGATVVICQPTDDAARDAAGRLRTADRRIWGIGADLRRAPDCSAVVEAVIQEHGRIDLLINNAAVTGPPALGDFLSFDDEHLDAIVDVNLKAVFRCSRRAAADMGTRRHGVIVNVASVGAFAAQPDAAAYVASKAGVVGLTKALGFELAPVGIRVVAVAPGDIATTPDASADAEDLQDTGGRALPWRRATPAGRRGRPEDVAAAVEFLCSDRSSFITGTTLIVDGGWLSY